MNHAASHHFNPPALLADPTALPIAEEATNGHFSTGFSERKEAGMETGLHLLPKEFFDEVIQHSFQVCKIGIVVNGQAFNLMEHG